MELTPEILHVQERNRIDLKFNGKPESSVLDFLKSLGFKWHRKNGVWFNQFTADTIEKVKAFFETAKFTIDESFAKRETRVKGTQLNYSQQAAYLALRITMDFRNENKSWIIEPTITTYLDGTTLVVNRSYTHRDHRDVDDVQTKRDVYTVTKNGKIEKLWEQEAYQVDLASLKPFEVARYLNVPRAKQKPFYDLSDGARPKINRANLLRELVAGKMEVAQSQAWNSHEDYYDHIKNEDMNWFDPSEDGFFFDRVLDDFIFTQSHTAPHVDYTGNISIGNFAIRYRTKAKKLKTNTIFDKSKVAARFLKTAEALLTKAKKKFDELVNALTNTPKRLREANSKRIDAEILEEKGNYYAAVGEAWETDTLPEILHKLSPVAKVDHFHLFVRAHASSGYYDSHRHNDVTFQRYPESYKGMMDELGYDSLEKTEQAYNALISLTGQTAEISEEEKKKAEINKLEGEVKFKKLAGFFPTTPNIIEQLLDEADIQEGHSILEPSAGIGSIAEAIRDLYPDNPLDVVELKPLLRDILELKGFTVAGWDFLEHTKKYDRIIMNPPFEKGQDIEHVQHAFSLLNEGGRIVGILSEGSFFNSQKKFANFRAFLSEHESWDQKLPAGSFKSAFVSTGVNTRMLVLSKEGVSVPITTGEDMVLAPEPEGISDGAINIFDMIAKPATKVLDVIKAKAKAQKQKLELMAIAMRMRAAKTLTGFKELDTKNQNVMVKEQAALIQRMFAPKQTQTVVESMRLQLIHANTDLFQNREAEYSQSSVDRIIAAIKDGSFSWGVFDPVLLWRRPADGKLFILSGHSRTHAFRLASQLGLTASGKSFDSIPAKVIETDEKNARQIAHESNVLATQETDVERSNYYRLKRTQDGLSHSELSKLAKKNEGRNAIYILNLSFLNPEGFAIDNLRLFDSADETSRNSLRSIADWTGEARRRFQVLTDAHETEIAKWLLDEGFGNKAGQLSSKSRFMERLNAAVMKATEFGVFASDKSLNLARNIGKSDIEIEHDERVSIARKEQAESQKMLTDKVIEVERAKTRNSITNELAAKVIEKYRLMLVNATAKLTELVGQRFDILKAASSQVALFSPKH
jgi:hypothetical protein